MNKNLKKVISSTVALSLSASAFLAFAGAASAAYPDVASDNAYAAAINNLTALGIVSGDDTGNFNPDATLKRSEAAKMIVEAFTNNSSVSQTATQFTDVPASHWASGYIAAGVGTGYINGYGDGTFGPDDTLTYAQIIKLIVGAMNYSTDAEIAGGYPSGYMQIASQNDINKGFSIGNDEQVTRAQVAQLIDNALDAPMSVYDGVETNVWGQSVPKYKKMDGNGTYYESPLTKIHDTYVVEGRVEATKKSDSALNEDEVIFSVEYSRRFDDLYFKKNEEYGSAQRYKMVVGKTDAADYMLTYAEAYVTENEDGDWEIIAFNPSGKNVETTFNASVLETDNKNYNGYKSLGDAIIGEGKIYTTSPKATYSLNLDDNKKTSVGVFVNGVRVDNSSEKVAEALNTFIDANAVGEVTLIDTPSSTGSSTDGKYDYIMITYYMSGVVSGTSQTSTQSKIFLDEFQNIPKDASIGSKDVSLKATLILPEDSDDMIYTVKSTDGKEMSIEDLQEGDVISVSYNVVDYATDPNSSSFMDIIVSRNTVEGKVTSKNDDDSVTTYTIDGSNYAAAEGMADDLEVGESYFLKLDAFGRYVSVEESTSTNLYGVVDRVWNSSNTEDDQVKLITATGKVETYVPSKDEVYTAALAACYQETEENRTGSVPVYTTKDKDGKEKTWYVVPDESANKDELIDRVVEYKINSKGEISSIKSAEDVKMADGSFKESTTKLDTYRLSESAAVVDISDNYDPNKTSSYSSSDVSLSDVSMFEDDEDYKAIVANKTTTGDPVYRFVLVLEGTTGIGVKTSMAVVNSTGKGSYNDDDTLNYIEVVTKGSAELTKVYLSDDMKDQDADTLINELKKGDAVVYSMNGEGTVDSLTVLFSGIDAANVSSYNRNMFEKYAVAKANDKDDEEETWYQTFYADKVAGITVPTKWKSSKENARAGYARIAFGPVVDKTANSITLAKVVYDDSAADGKKYYTTDSQTMTLSYASDVNFYVCDYNESKTERIAKGAAGSVIKTNIPKNAKDSDGTIYWNSADSGEYFIETINYAFVKLLDGDVTDVYFINGYSD